MITCRFSIGKNKVEGNEVNQAKDVSEIHFVSDQSMETLITRLIMLTKDFPGDTTLFLTVDVT